MFRLVLISFLLFCFTAVSSVSAKPKIPLNGEILLEGYDKASQIATFKAKIGSQDFDTQYKVELKIPQSLELVSSSFPSVVQLKKGDFAEITYQLRSNQSRLPTHHIFLHSDSVDEPGLRGVIRYYTTNHQQQDKAKISGKRFQIVNRQGRSIREVRLK
ncbi:MAG: hypothetical protein OEZ47_16055 [Gammaproteobacteria bacterium]|nr:hypothetical protein [Gammaproteobacteria bacterium]